MLSDSSKDQSSGPTKLGPRNDPWVAPFSLVTLVALFIGSQLVTGLVIYQVASLFGWSVDRTTNWLSGDTLGQFLSILLSEAIIVLGIYGLLRFLRWSWQTIGIVKPKLAHIFIGLIAFVPYFILYGVILLVLTQLFPSLNVDQKQEIGFDSVAGNWQLGLTFISLVILPPLVEEIAVRGYLYSGFRKWLPRIVAAILVSIVFGSAHLGQGGAAGPLWVGAIDTFTLSIVLVYLREKTGNLWAGITLHALKNAVAFTLIYIIGVS